MTLRIDTDYARKLAKNRYGVPHPVRRMLTGEQSEVFLIDLKDALPAYGKNGGVYEAYTSVIWIGHARLFSVTPRTDVERDGLAARLKQDEAALRSVGLELI